MNIDVQTILAKHSQKKFHFLRITDYKGIYCEKCKVYIPSWKGSFYYGDVDTIYARDVTCVKLLGGRF